MPPTGLVPAPAAFFVSESPGGRLRVRELSVLKVYLRYYPIQLPLD